jgi:enterochelin esterase-like enzyme
MRVSVLSAVVLAVAVSAAGAGWTGVRLPVLGGTYPDGAISGAALPGVSGATSAPAAPPVRDRSAWQPSPVPATAAAVPAPMLPATAGRRGAPAPALPATPPAGPAAAAASPAVRGTVAAAGPGASDVQGVTPMAAARTAAWLEGQCQSPGGLPEARGEWREVRFFSRALGRETVYLAWLPPGYTTGPQRGGPGYPTLYLLHGAGGPAGFGVEEWLGYALTEDLDRLVALGLIEPLIVVLPDGEQGYWINHADGGPRWADFVAVDLVSSVDATFFTDPRPARRAVGGLSMGGHGALQLGLNHPEVFGVVGAHSPTLRPFETSPAFFGDPAWFARFDPPTLAQTTGAAGRVVTWIDIGADDRWRPAAEALRDQLVAHGGTPTFRVLEGEHEGWYWMTYLPEYLGFYSATLARG